MNSVKVFLVVFICSLAFFLTPPHVKAQSADTSSIADAQIVSIQDTGKENTQNHQHILQVKLRILSGDQTGKEFTIADNTVALPYQIHYKEGSKVVVTISNDGTGNKNIYITDYDRSPILLLLFALFLVITLF